LTDEAAAPMPDLPADTADIPEPIEDKEVPQTVLDPSDDDDSPDGGDDTGDDDAGLDDPAEPEYVTLERNGKSYQVPKELEGEFLMQSDYTKKTQTVAERAKALDEREQQLAKQAETTEEELNARATLRSVADELAAYQKLTADDWQAHLQNDPMGTQQHRMRFEALRDQKADLERTIGTAETQRTEKAQQDLAKRVQETLEAATTIIPGITAETRGPMIDKLVNFATSEGIPEQVLRDNWSPTLLGLLHKASIGAQAIAKQSAPKPAPKPVAPLQTVRTATSPTASKSVADLAKSDDMEAYAAARAAGKRR